MGKEKVYKQGDFITVGEFEQKDVWHVSTIFKDQHDKLYNVFMRRKSRNEPDTIACFTKSTYHKDIIEIDFWVNLKLQNHDLDKKVRIPTTSNDLEMERIVTKALKEGRFEAS